MSERERLVEILEYAESDYNAVKYKYNHESSIALRCLEEAQEKLDEFDGVSDSQKIKDLERQLAEAREESKLKKDLISQVSKICLLLQMGKAPSQEDFRELMSLERAYRTFEEF